MPGFVVSCSVDITTSMSLTKYASLESGQVLGVKSSPERLKTASLDKFAGYGDYRTEDGYLYARIRAISSRTNKNHDGWPTAELAGGKEAWDKISSTRTSGEGLTIEASKDSEYGFSTFIGKPNFVDHHNSDPKRARGVIVDSKFSVLDHKTASQDDYWKKADVDAEHLPASEVELLVEIDAKTFPKYAKAIVNGDLDGWSMGCDVDYSKCSHCDNKASSPDEYCSHIISKGAEHTASDGQSKKSYENCYGIKFFEISGVFDPADETALSREVKASVEKEAQGVFNLPEPHEVLALATKMMRENPGSSIQEMIPLAEKEISSRFAISPDQVQGGDGATAPYPMRKDYTTPPQTQPVNFDPDHPYWQKNNIDAIRPQGATKIAQPELPQDDHIHAPEEVDTHREEKVCPLCGSDMDADQCDVCGYEEPPEQFQNPDLHANDDQDMGMDQENTTEIPNENPVTPPEPSPESMATQTRNPQPTPSVNSSMRWIPKTASAPRPQGDEPNETVTSDQTTPVTAAMRTARQMIDAAQNRNQENKMANEQRTAAEPVPAAKADKRVNVEGVGGVADGANNADASKPEGAHSWESEGTTVDVTGKGGVLQDSNAEASKPSGGTESIGQKDQDNAGYQSGGETGPNTKTFDNSNEPASAVTDKSFPTAAAKGVKPNGGADVQPQRREDVESDAGFKMDGTPTDQWTGTGGNGVTKQQDPVTNVPTQSGGIKASGLISIAALKLADTEVALGLLPEAEKYNRMAELSAMPDAEIEAEHRALAKVKTAGLTRTASTGGVSRLPSFKRIASDSPIENVIDDDVLDSGLYG